MLKKSKIISGICLIAQSFVCIVMAFISLKKKNKGLFATLLALGGVGGLTGAWLLYDECKNVSESKLFDLDNADCDDEEDPSTELFGDEEDQDIHFSFAQEEKPQEDQPEKTSEQENDVQ